MRRFRTHWLAVLGAMLLLSLSVSSAFGHHPAQSDNRGSAVSTFVHELVFGTDEDPEEEQGEDGEDEEEGEEEEQSELVGGSSHGLCVREVAWSLGTGGLNENHGGAVSEAARLTCWDGEGDESTEDSEEEDEGGHGESASAKDRGDRGRSAAAQQKAPGRNKVEGRAAGPGNGNAGGGGQGNGNARGGGHGNARDHGNR